MNKIAVKRADGGVSIIIPGDSATPELMERDALRVEGYVSHREIEDDEIPTDRAFRNAWTDESDVIEINIAKAQEIKKEEFRGIRKPVLESLDIEYMKALESGDKAQISSIIAKKENLRNVTKVDLPDTVEELKTFLPDVLKDE